MKKNALTVALAFACLLSSIYLASRLIVKPTSNVGSKIIIPPSIYSSEEVELIIPPSLPSVPTEIPCLRVIYENMDPEFVKEAGEEIFGFSGEIEEKSDILSMADGGGLMIKSPYNSLTVYRSGKVVYHRDPTGLPPVTTLTNEEAVRAVENLLKKIEAYGLMPKNPDIKIEFQSVGPGSISVIKDVWKENRYENIREIDYLSVIYEIKYREFPIDRALVSASVREGGIITGFALTWREVKEDGSIAVATSKEVIERLRSGEVITRPFSSIKTIEIKDVKLGYFLARLTEKQDYLTPVYLFDSVYTDFDGSHNWTFLVPGAVEPKRWAPISTMPSLPESLPIGIAEPIEEVTESIASTDDVHISEGYLDNNFGDKTALYMQSYTDNYKNERIFLKFDLSTIPTGSIITQAELYLYCWRGGYDEINALCYSVGDDSWDEGTITWNNQPMQGEVLDRVPLEGLKAENNWHSWNVTHFVTDEFKDDKVASFCLKAKVENSSGRYAFTSKEWWNNALHPCLKITYVPPRYAASLSISSQSKERIGLRGMELTYEVRITNRGSMEGDYVLSVNDTLGWPITISPTVLRENHYVCSFVIPPGRSGVATVSVTIPEKALLGEEDVITVNATSGAGSFATFMFYAKTADKIIENITPIDDAHLAEGYPDNNLGDATALYLQSYKEGYKNEKIFLKFDLNDIPAGLKIERARLYLYCWRGKYDSVDAQCVSIDDDSWSEGTITWNNQPAQGEVLATIPLENLAAEGKWHSWDVSPFVADEFKRDKVVSFCLKAAAESTSGLYAFESKEWWDVALRPYLEVILGETR